MVKRIFTIVITLLLILIPTFTVNAEVPYESYTYWSNVGEQDKAVYNRPMYSADFDIDASDLGIADFSKINDITFDASGNLYILDKNSRIVVLDAGYNFIKEIGLIGGTESYEDAKGMYIGKDNTVYICDTEGHRILHINTEGSLIEKITLPKSNLIPDDFDFRPTNMVIDDYGYTWVFSDSRLNLMKCNDETLLKFLSYMFHPLVRIEKTDWQSVLQDINKMLAEDGYEIFESEKISGKSVYSYRYLI